MIAAATSPLIEHNKPMLTYYQSPYKEVPYVDNNLFVLYSKKTTQQDIEYEFSGSILGKVPNSLKDIITCIKYSENILTLEDNWDTEGSKSFSEITWKAAAIFLIEYSKQVNNTFGYVIDTPKIYPGPNGSIDIDWETSNYGLIINIAEGGDSATYYGDNKNRQMTEGIFNPDNFNIHLLPLAIQY